MFSNLCGPTLLVLLCGAGQAASPVRVAEMFSLTNDVGFGNSVFVAGNHADVGNWNPTNAVKLRWTPGNIWTGRIGIQACAGEAVCHAGESPVGRIRLFTTESCVREEAARRNPKARRRLNCPVATTVNLIE